jgi:hypothetical protein
MRRKPLIDDFRIADWAGEGPPIRFKNPEIRKMLGLAAAGPHDVFYDLGSGWGQNLIIAATELKVRRATGIEVDKERYAKSVEQLKKWKLKEDQANVILGDFEKLPLKSILKDATIVFFGLSTEGIIKKIQNALTDGCKLVYYDLCLFPEIMPVKVEFPFYLSVFPFKTPRSMRQWLSAVVEKKQSSIRNGKPAVDELWDELTHDYDVEGIRDEISDYRRRLKRVIS